MKKTIIAYFEDTVARFPEHVAVADAETEYTYKALQKTAKAVATGLSKQGIFKKPVAIFMKRSAHMPAAMLSVLYSGNFYVILDYESPLARIEKILNTLQPAAILYEAEYLEEVKAFSGTIPVFEFEATAQEECNEAMLAAVAEKTTSEDPAYALFTSGSTGVPKGALLTNLNVVSYIHWFTKAFSIDENTVFGSQTSLYFSMSVSDFYASLFTGATYTMIPKAYFAFPAKLISFMNERKIDTIYWVPSALGIVAKFNLFKYCLPKYLKRVLFAGEVMPVKYLNYWRQYLPDALYANLFGPTETTDICAYYVVNREFAETESVPIGVACDNCDLFLVDADGKDVTESGIGELYVRSPFVAKGYYGNAEKTKEAFVQNPLHDFYPETVYKTGDLARKNALGEFEYIGRKDFQIKHLGYRIEPSEIETMLNTVPGVELTVCVYDAESDNLLLAYEADENKDTALNEAAEKLLPHYMRPTYFYKFEAFPKNANGKIDRKEIKKIILENK